MRLSRITCIIFCSAILMWAIPITVKAMDSDNDGLSDEQEAIFHCDPRNPDSDADGFKDGEEVRKGYSPLAKDKKMSEVDTDRDGFSDFQEIMSGYDLDDRSPVQKNPVGIVVDKTKQRLYYQVSSTTILDFPVSTGILKYQTPTGVYSVTAKIPVKRYIGPDYNLPNVKWNMQFLPGYYLHSAYWHNNFGKKPYSHGCVNMLIADAELLYTYVSIGTQVTVVGKNPRNDIVN